MSTRTPISDFHAMDLGVRDTRTLINAYDTHAAAVLAWEKVRGIDPRASLLAARAADSAWRVFNLTARDMGADSGPAWLKAYDAQAAINALEVN